VQKLLASVQQLGLEIDMIAPDHGLIWRSHPVKIIEAYDGWSRQKTRQKAVIIYDTMWHATETMARAIADGLIGEGVSVRLCNLRVNHRSEVMTEVLDARALLFGSATFNNGMLPLVADILCYVKGLRPLNRIGAAFGSYGWSGEAVKLITQTMEEMKIEILDPGLRVKFTPNGEDLKRCEELGQKIGKAVKERA
jgi:flavorubredoxin